MCLTAERAEHRELPAEQVFLLSTMIFASWRLGVRFFAILVCVPLREILASLGLAFFRCLDERGEQINRYGQESRCVMLA
jgi:hypothetical protein